MSKTKIEWTSHSWNPITGCSKISPGCRNCYAERMARRLAGRYGYPEAPHHFDVTLHYNKRDEPVRRRKPTMYFVCSMGDLFHEDVEWADIAEIWEVMDWAEQHTFQVLTKRPRRMLKFLLDYWMQSEYHSGAVLPNVWLGVSVENQATADERRTDFEAVPAAVKFVSYEPALGSLNWSGWEFVRQIISGGETGPGARPSHPNWYRATRDFCQENDIAYFHKHNGMYVLANGYNQWGTWLKGELVDPSRVQSVQHRPDLPFPPHMVRVGKKRAGHLLDGQEWREFPT